MARDYFFREALRPVLVATFVLLVSGLAPALAQDRPQGSTPAQTNPSDKPSIQPDIEIRANVTARELKFEQVGNPKVEFPGKPKRDTVWDADRKNLPQTVEPGVTYRDISVRLVITSSFAEIDKIISDILGAKLTQENEESLKETQAKQSSQSPAPAQQFSPRLKARKARGKSMR